MYDRSYPTSGCGQSWRLCCRRALPRPWLRSSPISAVPSTSYRCVNVFAIMPIRDNLSSTQASRDAVCLDSDSRPRQDCVHESVRTAVYGERLLIEALRGPQPPKTDCWRVPMQLSLKQPMSERQHPCGSSRLPFPALMQTGATPQQQYPTGPQPVSSAALLPATAVSPFAMCSSSFGPTFQQPPHCMPASNAKLCSPPSSRVASPTSVLEGDYMLDEAVTPARRVNSMSRTISMRNVSGCLPESMEV